MENLPLAFGAGVALGITSGLFEFNMPRYGSVDRRRGQPGGDPRSGCSSCRSKRSRADDAEETFSSTGILKPIPDALRSLPEVVAGRVGILALRRRGHRGDPARVRAGHDARVHGGAHLRDHRHLARRPDRLVGQREPGPVRLRRRRGRAGRRPDREGQRRPLPEPGRGRRGRRRPGRGRGDPGPAHPRRLPGRGHARPRGGDGHLLPEPDVLPRTSSRRHSCARCCGSASTWRRTRPSTSAASGSWC